jgi:signal transduction histidine kinase
MKKSTKFILLTVFALIVLVGLQSYSLLRIYQLEVERIENLYKETIRSGLNSFEEEYGNVGLEAAFKALDGYSKSYYEYLTMGGVSDSLLFRQIVLSKMHEEFDSNKLIDGVIKKILQKKGYSTRFKTIFVFREFQFESWKGEFPVYDTRSDLDWEYPDTLSISDNAMTMGTYRNVGTNYSCTYDFLIDFKEMKVLVLKEITGVSILMLLSLIIIGLISILTVRNMLEERRLSLLKTDFINNMTHELKTPLSTISIAAKTLKNEKILSDKEKIKGTVRVIDRQNKNLSKQINHLLEVSMWERRQFEMEKSWVCLHDLLLDLIESFRMECKDQPVTIVDECNLPKEYEVFVDETQIGTALHNLMANSVKYNESNPVINISCALLADHIFIKVRDNGIGISKENSKHIFEKFYRVHTGNIHKVKGLGLGLFYVRQIIEAHQGTISLNSKLGKGSEFTIKLPNNGRSKNITG